MLGFCRVSARPLVSLPNFLAWGFHPLNLAVGGRADGGRFFLFCWVFIVLEGREKSHSARGVIRDTLFADPWVARIYKEHVLGLA